MIIDIPDYLKSRFIDGYNKISNKTSIKFHNKHYREFVMNPIEDYYYNEQTDDTVIKTDDDIEKSSNVSLKDKF